MQRWLLQSPIHAWLLLLILAPNVIMVVASFWRSDGGAMIPEWSLANYTKVMGSETYRLLVFRTLATAAAAALTAALIAYPMAYFVSRNLRRHKLTAVLLVIIPLWVSLLIRVFAWRIILGQNGVLNSALVWLGILEHPWAALLYTRFTVFLTLTYVAIPFVFVTSFSALERIPHSLIEASQDSGAGGWRTFWNVVWPLSKQGAALGFALAFLLAIGDYITPAMVGGLDGTMLGMIIASQFGLVGNWPLGAAMAVTLMLVVSVLLAVIAYFARSPGVLEANQGEAAPPAVRRRGFWGRLRRRIAWTLFVLPYGLLYLPLLTISIFSFNDSTVQALPLAGFTTRWYEALITDSPILNALERSLAVGLGAVAASTVFGVLFALIFTHVRVRGSGLIQGLMSIPVAMPGVVLGVSLISAFRIIDLPAGIFRITLGHVTFIMPVIMLIVLARLQRLDPSLEQASMDLGANRWRTFAHVTLPLIRSALIGGALLGFTLSLDEVIVTLFLTGVEPTLPVYVWNQMRFGFTPTVNAIFTCIGVFSLLMILVATRLLRTDPGHGGSGSITGITG
jgi:spermidine/putrescine transport system permease protein